MEKDTSIKRILDTPHSSALLAKVYFQVIYKTYFPTESNPHFMSVPDIQPVFVPENGSAVCEMLEFFSGALFFYLFRYTIDIRYTV